MRAIAIFTMLLLSCTAFAEDAKLPDSLDLNVGGKPWLRTMCKAYDPNNRDETYKVFTHLLSFDGSKPITKGAGGKYPHHRGLFIGWRDTVIGDRHIDTWHMPECSQQLSKVLMNEDGQQVLSINWVDKEGKTFVKEARAIVAHAEGDLRVVDFATSLNSDQKIQFKGDLQHAGMHVRMAQEVADRDEAETKAKTTSKDSTSYILPEGAQTLPDDKVTGAWWVCCSCVVEGKRYWILHMSPPSTPGGVPVYSIRKYARFGSFFEPSLEPGKPLDLHFRIAVSEKELDQKACQALYDAFAKEHP